MQSMHFLVGHGSQKRLQETAKAKLETVQLLEDAQAKNAWRARSIRRIGRAYNIV